MFVMARLILHETPQDGVLHLTMNQPERLNALNAALIDDLVADFQAADRDPSVRAIVLSGAGRAFAAGADLDELSHYGYPGSLIADIITPWDAIAATRKPLIAAVHGYALGGGFEIALMADLIVAAETAVFGLPETSVGLIPGGGGTQRLTRACGKALAMDVVLSGRKLTAAELASHGLVSRVVPEDTLLDDAIGVAAAIAEKAPVATLLAKEAILRSFDSTLTDGIRSERRALQSLFATKDAAEGIAAFRERRPARFTGE